MADIFVQISLIILVVLVVSFIMRLLKQPLIIGYIISGILAGPLVFNLISGTSIINVFSELGIAFLLFIVGLHLSPKVIKDVGKISLITGIGQVIFTSLIGYFIAIAFGFSPTTALYIAIALTFSSTIIIMKLLSDKGDLGSLYGKISIGFLLIQDLIAIFILIVVSAFSSGENIFNVVGLTLLKGVILVGILIPIGIYVLPRFERFFARSQEFLFIFSIAWGLGLAALFFAIGLSIEVGALIAGVILSLSPYSIEISSKLRPLRDFFIISFFILLGSQMILQGFNALIFPAIIFSLFILIGNPLIVMVLMGLFGYTKRTGFKAGLTVAQISEFSLILIALGVRVGHLTPEILSFVTVIGLITIAGSTYMIIYSDKIYKMISSRLNIFQKKNTHEKKKIKKDYDAILFGYNRIGFSILRSLKKIKKKYLVVDFNPDIITDLKKFKIPSFYGDAYDVDLLEELPLKKVGMIISTVPDPEANALLVKTVRDINSRAVIVVRAHSIDEALELYKKGATYVLMPHFLGGEYMANMIKNLKVSKEGYAEERKKHISMLTQRIKLGHKHPHVEKN